MVANIDRTKVQGAFHRQAGDYDSHAVVQGRVVAKLVGLLQARGLDPARVLDIGAGTGRLLAALDRRLICERISPFELILPGT